MVVTSSMQWRGYTNCVLFRKEGKVRFICVPMITFGKSSVSMAGFACLLGNINGCSISLFGVSNPQNALPNTNTIIVRLVDEM
jgi:hypothetical protein